MISVQSEPAERVEAKVETPFHHRKIQKGALYFVIFTVAGLALLYFMTQTPQTLEALIHLDARFLAIAIALAVVDVGMNALRYHLFLRKIEPGVSPWLSFRAHWANIFMGAVTPSQTAGGPAQIYIFYRGGISLPNATFVAVINFFFTVVFFLVAATFALIFLRASHSQGLIRYLVHYGFFCFFGLFVLYFFALVRPDLLSSTINTMAKFFVRAHRGWGERILQFSKRIIAGVDSYRASCKRFFRDEKILLLAGFGFTTIMYLNKFTLAFFLMRGLGVEVDFLYTIAIQTVIMFVLYLAPTPGGSGIAELSIAVMMSTIMADYLLSVFTVLYRFFILYLPALVGFFIVMRELKSHAQSSGFKSASESSPIGNDPLGLTALNITENTPRDTHVDQIQSGGMF